MYLFTKYLSVATDTRIRSSPTRTFSPSDLCFEAGCTVHQQASPIQQNDVVMYVPIRPLIIPKYIIDIVCMINLESVVVNLRQKRAYRSKNSLTNMPDTETTGG